MPFGSSSEKTKQLKAARNCAPQVPCAIPPRHGQSQLISPVSGLKAPPAPPLSLVESPSALGSSEGGGEEDASSTEVVEEDGESEGGVGREEEDADMEVFASASFASRIGGTVVGNASLFNSESAELFLPTFFFAGPVDGLVIRSLMKIRCDVRWSAESKWTVLLPSVYLHAAYDVATVAAATPSAVDDRRLRVRAADG